MDGGDAQAPWTPTEIAEGEWAGWRIWSSDPYELLSGPFYSREQPDGSMLCAFRAEAKQMNGGGFMHGGALMGLADNCGGLCAFLNLPEGAKGTATIESKTNFMRAVRDGAVTASTRPLHAGRNFMVLETELARDDGKLAAKVTQTQAFQYG